MNYSELQTAIANFMHRGDLTGMIPTFIQLAESSLFREIRPKALETSVSGVTSGGVIALPADFGSVSRVTITYAGVESTLDYQSIPDNTISGSIPTKYALENDVIRLFPSASDGLSYKLYYIAKIPALSGSQTTNWLLDNASDLYMYASCLEAAKYIRSPEQVNALSVMVPPLIEAVKRADERRGNPSNGSLQVKPRR